MNSAQRTVALARLVARNYSTAAPGQPSSHFQSLKAKQAKFQCDDGLPVFLKGGVMDKILYQTTVVLCFVGTGMMAKLFWDLSVPKK
ncbi:Cytochrome c oxidase subunit 7A [Carabus blaptoides fortunei]